jgi:hypothetical protein
MPCASHASSWSHVYLLGLTGKRKLKCSGEPAGCDRCIKQKLTCHYSAQKQMGRPRKRQKTDGEFAGEETDPVHHTAQTTSVSRKVSPPKVWEQDVDPALTEKEIERTNFQNICVASLSQSVKRSVSEAQSAAGRTSSSKDSGTNLAGSQGSSTTSPDDAPRTPSQGSDRAPPAFNIDDISQWPDFSDMTMLPMIVQDRIESENSMYGGDKIGSGFATSSEPTPYSTYLSGRDADPNTMGQIPSMPACPCLPNLYLTLSTLSSLSAFPISSGMIDTLLNAHRTCRSVIYCGICPQKMASGSQNVFLSTMLVTVLADHWHRVKRATATELKAGFGTLDVDPVTLESSSSIAGVDSNGTTKLSLREDLEWRTFGYRLIRAFVWGDQPIPDPPNSVPGGALQSLKRKPQITPAHVSSEETDTSAFYSLDSLVQALERRQKQWHDIAPYHSSMEFPPKLAPLHHVHGDNSGHPTHQGFPAGYCPGMTLEDIEKVEDAHRASGGGDEGLLCLRIVKHSRLMMGTLQGGPPVIEG